MNKQSITLTFFDNLILLPAILFPAIPIKRIIYDETTNFENN